MSQPTSQDDLLRRILDAVEANKVDTASRFESLRRELSALFVPKAEYDPKHAILQEKIIKLEATQDRMLTQDNIRAEELIRVKGDIRDITKDLTELTEKQTGTMGRIATVLAVVVSVGSLVITFIQHIKIT